MFVQQALRGRRLAVVGHIGLRARHVDEHHPGRQHAAVPRPAEEGYLLPLAQRFERFADGEVVVVDTLPAVAQHRQRVGIYAAEHEDERGRLQRRTCGLHRDARPQRQVGVARGVDEVTGDERLGAVLVLDDDVRDPPLLRPAAGQVGVKIERHACFEQHPLGDELVLLGREGDIAQRLLLLGASDSGEPFDELPRDAADDAAAVVVEDADRRHQSGGSHAAEESVALDERRTCPAARGSDRSDQAGRSAAADHDVVRTHDRNFFRLCDEIHRIECY